MSEDKEQDTRVVKGPGLDFDWTRTEPTPCDCEQVDCTMPTCEDGHITIFNGNFDSAVCPECEGRSKVSKPHAKLITEHIEGGEAFEKLDEETSDTIKQLRDQLKKSEDNALELHRSGTIFYERLEDIGSRLSHRTTDEVPPELVYIRLVSDIQAILDRSKPGVTRDELREALADMLTAYEGEYTQETEAFHHQALEKARSLLSQTLPEEG